MIAFAKVLLYTYSMFILCILLSYFGIRDFYINFYPTSPIFWYKVLYNSVFLVIIKREGNIGKVGDLDGDGENQ